MRLTVEHFPFLLEHLLTHLRMFGIRFGIKTPAATGTLIQIHVARTGKSFRSEILREPAFAFLSNGCWHYLLGDVIVVVLVVLCLLRMRWCHLPAWRFPLLGHVFTLLFLQSLHIAHSLLWLRRLVLLAVLLLVLVVDGSLRNRRLRPP